LHKLAPIFAQISEFLMKVVYDRKKCIGCGSCAVVCADFWEMAKDGKAILKKGKLNQKTTKYEVVFEWTDERGCNSDAVDVCPVKAITLED